MGDIIEIPITDVDRVWNRKPQSVDEWLEVQGVDRNVFTSKQLESIDLAIRKVNERLIKGSE